MTLPTGVDRLVDVPTRSPLPPILTAASAEAPALVGRDGEVLSHADLRERVHQLARELPDAAHGRLLFAASVERQRVLAAEFVIGSAATLRLVDGAEFVNRIKPALETLGVAWARLERDLAPLSGWRRADPDLGRAAEEMRAGLREITHDGAGLASPQTMADRTDLVVASRSLQLGASLGSEVAHAMREAIDEIVWTVPARGASKVHQALGVAPTPVDSASVRTGAVLPLSDVGLRALAAHVDDVARAARTVDSTGSAVHTALQGRPASGREHQERALTYAPGGAPVPGAAPASGPLMARGV